MAYEWRIIFLTIFNGHTFTQKLPIFLISPFFLSNHPMTNAHRPISYHRLRKAVVFPGPRTATNWSFTSSPDISLYSGGQQGICCCLVRWHILSQKNRTNILMKARKEEEEGLGGGRVEHVLGIDGRIRPGRIVNAECWHSQHSPQ